MRLRNAIIKPDRFDNSSSPIPARTPTPIWRISRSPEMIKSISNFLHNVERGQPIIPQGSTAVDTFWNRELYTVVSAVVGQVLYPKSIPDSADINKIIKCPHEFLTVVPGVRGFLVNMDSRSRSSKQHEQLIIRMTPSEVIGAPDIATKDLPDFDIRIAIDTENQTTSLHSARLAILGRQSDLLLPSAPMDLRFKIESYFVAGKQIDQRIHEFVDASNFNIWGQDRLKTPASLTISIPEYAIQPSVRTAKLPGESNSEIQVAYAFASLNHRSSVQDKFRGSDIQYSIIEAGRTGGRREELLLSLPEDIDTNYNKESFTTLFRVAQNLVHSITFPEEFTPYKHSGPHGSNIPSKGRRLVRHRPSNIFKAESFESGFIRRTPE